MAVLVHEVRLQCTCSNAKTPASDAIQTAVLLLFTLHKMMMRAFPLLVMLALWSSASIEGVRVAAASGSGGMKSSSPRRFAIEHKPSRSLGTARVASTSQHLPLAWVPGQRINRFIDGLFDAVDRDHDGSVSLDELYERVLLMYIKINQQASVPPPTRETVTALFHRADTNRSNRLERDQFKSIMKVIYSRAATRLVLAKMSKVILAPLLAVQTVRWASCSGCWWEETVVSKVPQRCQFLLDTKLWTTALTVLFVITLSGAVITATTSILDGLCGIDKKKMRQAEVVEIK